MKLADLDPHFLDLDGDGNRHTDKIKDADGLLFRCPKCSSDAAKWHYISVPFAGRNWQTNVKWNFSGTGYSDLTLTPSIIVLGDDSCKWHGFVTNGEIVNV